MKNELERYKEALEVAKDALISRTLGPYPSGLRKEDYDALERISKALNPPPDMETVEVVRWECEKCGYSYKKEPLNNICIHPRENHTHPSCTTFIKLTGTFERAKPQPVERSMEILLCKHDGVLAVQILGDGTCDDLADMTEGKRCNLTWEE